MRFSPKPLEFGHLKELLGSYVSSEPARMTIAAIQPSTDQPQLESQHALNQEAIEYLREDHVTFTDIPLLSDVLTRIGASGSILSIPEIEAVQAFLDEIHAFRQRWAQETRAFPRLRTRALQFPDLEQLRKFLRSAVRDGQVSEDYSPELKRLRRQLQRVRSQLQRKLEGILKSSQLKGQLQDELVTLRNGRYVIPVRADQKRTVAGIVHGSSSSGATVFMEPLETLEMNNELTRLEEQEGREVLRILGEVTDRIQENRDLLDEAARLWFELEALFGIARFARDFDCVTPRFSDTVLRLVDARHPLLEARLRGTDTAVVGLTLETDRDERLLVISGPNAGGKTVVLKTVGLLTLMAQSGFPVPAEEALLPLADHVLADIGDQQSIADQLSTFSAHVLEISGMVGAASRDSLILLDEIGSSTEPAEGAALAIAVLEHFRAKGSRVIATTHYNRLKMYAETVPGVRNASMEFDEATLEPTYRFLAGLAGQSSGLKIAERFGLPPTIIEAARNTLDRSEIDAARYVDELQVRVKELELEKQRLGRERQDFETYKKEMSARIEEDRAAEALRLEKQLDALVEEIRSSAESQLRTLGRESSRKFTRTLDRARDSALQEVRRPARSKVETPVSRPETGWRVRIHSLGVEGIVLGVLKDRAEVGVGHMKVERPFDDIELVSPPGRHLPDNVHLNAPEKTIESNEINLIGCSSQEALERLDKFLDDAFLGQLPSVRIIHGSGMGVLRRAIGEFLESHPHVSGFEFAPTSQGGRGVTVAILND